jgi:hypothetical protein
MDKAQLAWESVMGGMNSADPPDKIATNQVARMVNCAIIDGLPTTRPRVRVVPLSGDGSEVVSVGNIQGSIFHNPAKGQGGIRLSEENPMLALAVSGRKFSVHLRHGTSMKADVVEITNGLFTNSALHLVWWSAWENLLLAQDGNAKCFIWDSANPATFSRGYNTIDKPASEVPNGGTVMSYAHGRGVSVVNSRFVLVSDSLHRTDQSSSSNLRQFQEQVYWATGQYFLPPSAMGNITAAALLPLRNTQHGHGDLIVHCEDGAFSLDLNVFPREKWSEVPMLRHALLKSGATGPYALAVRPSDQVFRSRHGIQTLRSAASEDSGAEPNPTVSEAVRTWLDTDFQPWLRFASVEMWVSGKRDFCTTQPIVRGAHRWHRGALVRNLNPSAGITGEAPAWEGLWTLPSQAAGIIQFMSGIFGGKDRMLAWCRGADGRNRLVHFTRETGDDMLEDGTTKPIEAQVITRVIDAGEWWNVKEFLNGTLYLQKMQGLVKWSVYIRPEGAMRWYPWRSGEVDVQRGGLEMNGPGSASLVLGNVPDECGPNHKPVNVSGGLQCLIIWTGVAQVRGLRVSYENHDLDQDRYEHRNMKLSFGVPAPRDYNDFSYSL